MSNAGIFNPCVVIPVYNHHQVLRSMVAYIVKQDLSVILIDDGSDLRCRTVLEKIVDDYSEVTLVTHSKNKGKGAAMKSGFVMAMKMEFSHAMQIDADGQHDVNDIDRFWALSKAHPKALICGYPIFDKSVPRHRYYGRYASHVWVWINTLSTTIKDSMCGFRIYPLNNSCELLGKNNVGNRMQFDGEFIVRWYWQGYPIKQLSTVVVYRKDGISHFRLCRDNLLISWMHTRLFFGMLLRAPRLLRQTHQPELENEN